MACAPLGSYAESEPSNTWPIIELRTSLRITTYGRQYLQCVEAHLIYLHVARPDAPDGARLAPLALLSSLPLSPLH